MIRYRVGLTFLSYFQIKFALCVAAGIGPAVIACSAAQAADLPQAASQQIRVHGYIDQHCAISAPNEVDFGELQGAAKQADLKFGLDCNVPFVMQVQAQHGALTNQEYPQGQGPYAGSLPYALTFAIPTRRPGAAIVRRTFNSRDLIGGQMISSQGGIATEGMSVNVALGNSNSEAGLLAGEYGDTITLTISVI